MAESSDAGEIKAIGAGVANQLIQTMDCAVNLLPEFRAAALSQFSSAAKGTQHLLVLTEPGAAGPSGMILYGVEKGRRNTTTLSCRLLCVSGRTKAHVARALIDYSIGQHSATRMEAQVNVLTDWVAWWQSLGFEMAASTAVLEISAQRGAKSPAALAPAGKGSKRKSAASEASPAAAASKKPKADSSSTSAPAPAPAPGPEPEPQPTAAAAPPEVQKPPFDPFAADPFAEMEAMLAGDDSPVVGCGVAKTDAAKREQEYESFLNSF